MVSGKVINGHSSRTTYVLMVVGLAVVNHPYLVLVVDRVGPLHQVRLLKVMKTKVMTHERYERTTATNLEAVDQKEELLAVVRVVVSS